MESLFVWIVMSAGVAIALLGAVCSRPKES